MLCSLHPSLWPIHNDVLYVWKCFISSTCSCSSQSLTNPHWFEVSEVSLHCLINRWQDGIHHGHNQEHIQRLQDCYLKNSLSKISTGGGNWESGEKIAANIKPSTMHSSVRVVTKHCLPTFNLRHMIGELASEIARVPKENFYWLIVVLIVAQDSTINHL